MRNSRGRITTQRALDALRLLVDYGKAGHEGPISFGAAIGAALSKCDMRGNQIIEAAGEALEDQNHHLAAAIVRALKDGRNVRRNRRSVTITLPEVFHS